MTASKACDLCGLSAGRRPLTHTAATDGRTYVFCCMGCRQVFIMLLELSGNRDPAAFRTTELFQHCVEIGIIPRTEEEAAAFGNRTSRGSRPESLVLRDSPEDAKEEKQPEELLPLHLKISDMWCPACAWFIETALGKMPGIETASCNFSTDRLAVRYHPVENSPKRIIDSIGRLGYKASIPGEETPQKEKLRAFIRLILSAVLTMNVMMLSFSLYSGFFIELSRDAAAKISWPIFLMATVVVFYGGWPIARKALAGMLSFSFGMESLVWAGAFSAYFYSVYHLFSGSIHLYFDTASMLITLVLLGKMLERKAKDRIIETLDRFLSITPGKARIFSDSYPEGKYVPVEQLRRGDVFGVEPEEILPADGTILDGGGRLDDSLLTGEAGSVKKGPGDRLMSGSRVVEGRFRVKADAVGVDSVLGQMTQIMEKAMERKSVMEGPTEKILQWFVPTVFLLAIGTGFSCHWLDLSTKESMMRAIAVMVVSCPCALGIAIPLARVAGVSASGKIGILVRNFSSFEHASKIDAVVFDKTGTVTRGDWDLLDVVCIGDMTRERALSLAAVLEEDSDHQIAGVIKQNSVASMHSPVDIEHIAHQAQGVSGMLSGKEIRIGSKRFIEVEISKNDPIEINSPFFDDGLSSTVFMSIGHAICAAFIFGDTVKDEARAWVSRLKEMGMDLFLISGDDERITRKVAGRLGIGVSYGNKTPLEKAGFIGDLQRNGRFTAMVGDGLNDAPALAKADLAAGIYGKNPLGKETADITLMRGDPGQLLDFFVLARLVRKKIRQNFRFSFCYNIISIPIAMAGLLTPIVAVCAMLLSSLSVIGNTLSLVRKTSHGHLKNVRQDQHGSLLLPGDRHGRIKISEVSIKETGN